MELLLTTPFLRLCVLHGGRPYDPYLCRLFHDQIRLDLLQRQP
jgi:hypothetical protein